MLDLPEHVVILLVDDSENDIEIIRRAVERAGLQNRIVAINDSEEVMAYFEGRGRYEDRDKYPKAHLVLLDLKMPKVDGFEVLAWIRHRSELKMMPVIVLTSSDLLFDVTKAYELGASSYLVKPLEFENLEAMMRTLGAVWKQANSQRPLPPAGD
jgi:DNA-binding response OmpR family regulator